MFVLQATLVLLSVGAQDGARLIKSQSKKAIGVTLPFAEGCFLSSGFGVQSGCHHSPAVRPLPPCNPGHWTRGEACIHTYPDEEVRHYTRDVRVKRDLERLTETVVKAEGGGFGVKVSASFGMMKKSGISENSVSFFIGASGQTQTSRVLNPSRMKLSEPAKVLLAKDPTDFIRRYGYGYVYSMNRGGSFLGSVVMNSKKEHSASDMKAAASMSVRYGFFSAKGSASLKKAEEQSGYRLSVKVATSSVGGITSLGHDTNPESMGRSFRTWEESWRAHPKNLTLTPRPWYDCEDAQKIINDMSEENRSLFKMIVIAPHIEFMISKEQMAVLSVYTSVRRETSGSNVTQRAKECLKSLEKDINGKLLEMQTLDERDVFEIQQRYIQGTTGWFQSDNFRQRYDECQNLIDYEFLFDGICEQKRTMKDVHTRSTDECYRHCLLTEPCGSFSYWPEATGNNCLTYAWNEQCAWPWDNAVAKERFKTYRVKADFQFEHVGWCDEHNNLIRKLYRSPERAVANISECSLACRNQQGCKWFAYASIWGNCFMYGGHTCTAQPLDHHVKFAFMTFRNRVESWHKTDFQFKHVTLAGDTSAVTNMKAATVFEGGSEEPRAGIRETGTLQITYENEALKDEFTDEFTTTTQDAPDIEQATLPDRKSVV